MDRILSKVDGLLNEMLESGKKGEYNCKEPEAPTTIQLLSYHMLSFLIFSYGLIPPFS